MDHPRSRHPEDVIVQSRLGDVMTAQTKNRIMMSLLDLLQQSDAELRAGIEKLYYDLLQEVKGGMSSTGA